MIRFLNLIRPDAEAPFSEALNHSKIEVPDAKIHLKEFQQRFRALPEDFQAELLQRSAEKKKSFDKWRRVNAWCFRFNDWRETCRDFIEWAWHKFEVSAGMSVNYKLHFKDVLTIGEDGKTRRANHELIDALTDIEATRLRECQACQRFFWANRKEKQGCSVACNLVLRKRKQRNRLTEKASIYEAHRAKKEREGQ